MISHHRQSEISFWLLVSIGVLMLGAGIGLASAAVGNIAAVMNQPACGCGGATALSLPLMFGGGAGVLLAGWAAVTALLLAKQTRGFIGSLKVLRKANDYRVIDDSRAVAFTAGLLHPKIYLSTFLLSHLSNSERQAVVRHERFHEQRYDPLRIAVTETLQRIFRWLPGLTQLYRHWRLTRELAADASSTSEPQRLALGRSLVKLLEQPLIPTAVSAFSATEERVRELVSPSTVVRRQQWLVPAAATLVVLFGVIGLTVHSRSAEARTLEGDFMCPLTRQCIVEQLKKQSIAPVYVVCPAFSAAGGCFVVAQ